MMEYISVLVMPLLIAVIICYALLRRVAVFDVFICGAKEGMTTLVGILPSVMGLIIAVSMLRASGAIELLATVLSPALGLIGLPAEVLPLALLRPVSGSGSLALLNDILANCGADSLIGRMACVMVGSTDTTFYTIAVYFGAVGVTRTRHTVRAALTADAFGILASVIIVNLLCI